MKLKNLFAIIVLALSMSTVLHAQVGDPVSISQVIDADVKAPYFSALQSLIERYGVSGLTKNRRFNAADNLSRTDFQLYVGQAQNVLGNLAAASDVPSRLLGGKTCKVAGASAVVNETDAAQYLTCLGGFADSSMLAPGAKPLTRGRFAMYLDSWLGKAMGGLYFLSTEENLRKDFSSSVGRLIKERKYDAAQALFVQLETGKYDLGSPDVQKKLSADQSILIQKADLNINRRDFIPADKIYQKIFDSDFAEFRKTVSEANAATTIPRRRNAVSLAKGAIVLAKSTDTLRRTAYTLAGASKEMNPKSLKGFEELLKLEAEFKAKYP